MGGGNVAFSCLTVDTYVFELAELESDVGITLSVMVRKLP